MAVPASCFAGPGPRRIFLGLLGLILLLAGYTIVSQMQVPVLEETDKRIDLSPIVRRLHYDKSAGHRQRSFSEDKNILCNERLHHKFLLRGSLLNEDGASTKVEDYITTSVLHSFSPSVEKLAGLQFLDPPHDNVILANSPAIAWHRGNLVLVVRIWLARERYEKKGDMAGLWPANHFADNYLFTQKFDRSMRPLNNGSIIGIPTPKQWWVGDGPIEPRLFKIGDKLFISFNVAMAMRRKHFWDWTVLWDYDKNMPVIPKIKGGSPMIHAPTKDNIIRDKHWMAFENKGQLHFVHNLDPFRILKCDLHGQCHFVHQENRTDGFIFHNHLSHLRGGTPLELYKWPYYVGFAHTTLYKSKNNHRFYTAHLIVLCVRPYRLVYISDAIQINPKVYQSIPMVRHRYIDDGFIFPVGNILENKDTIALGVHVNDHSSILLRLRGVEKILSKVMDLDQEDNPKKGPKPGYMHHYIHHSVSNTYKIKFQH